MAVSYLYTLAGWSNFPTQTNTVWRFNNESGEWISTLATPPFAGTVQGQQVLRQQGCWDGTRWFVISPSGQLFYYTPATNTWSSALVSGTYLFSGIAEDKVWTMTSNGRVVYILSDAFDFREYDPVSDRLLGLDPVPAGTYGINITLTYDGSGTIYGHKGGSNGQYYKYNIASNTWSALASQGTMISDMTSSTSAFSAFLLGKFWVAYKFSGTIFKVFGYDPNTNTWPSSGVITDTAGFNMDQRSPYGEENDHLLRIWGLGTGSPSYDVNISSIAVSPVSPLPFSPAQGTNFTVARVFQAMFEWYTSGGITLLPAFQSLGSISIGQTNTFQAKVKTLIDQPSGITISVVDMSQTDADDPVTISNTLLGVYAKSFSTGALVANDFTNVFVKVVPTSSQTLGFDKQFNLSVVSNG